ncbi:MAG: hypothetical protein K5886_02955 [Lachnospiraceae bacterium]|nr:hypothetical protein [Lachnospiraceae bacterium]
MMKKVICAVMGLCFAAAGVFAFPNNVSAYPSTVNTINEAKAIKAACEAELANAQAAKAAADAAYASCVANKASQLEIEKAYFNAVNAANVVKGCVEKVNNAQAFINNASNRLYWEDEYIRVMGLWANQVSVDQARSEADFAAKQAANAAALVENTKKAIASQTLLAAGNPVLQAQVDTLKVQLAAYEADAAGKAAVAAEKKAAAANLEQNLPRKWDSGEDWYYDNMVLK